MFKVSFAFSMWMFLCLWREVYELNEPMECIISSTVAITGRRILLIMNLFKTLRNDPFCVLVSFYLGISFLAHAQEQRHMPMTKDIASVELNSKEVIEILNEGMSGIVEKSILNLVENPRILYFEVSNDRVRNVEDLSLRNRTLYKKNPEQFIKSIKRVQLFEKLQFTTDTGEMMLLGWRDAFGWGKMTKRSFEESYLLTGEFSDLAKKLGRFTPKKTEDYYRRYYQRALLGYSAGEVPLEKVDDQTWLFGYAMRLGFSNKNQKYIKVELKSICYLEKYAKSLEITSHISLASDEDENDLNILVKSEIDSLMLKNRTIAEMILLQIEEKELQPNEKSLQMLNNDRMKRTVGLGKTPEEKLLMIKDIEVPEFVKEIENIRLFNGEKEKRTKILP